LAGIEVTEANALNAGFQYDRRWMLVDEKGEFITQREIPNMALFHVSIQGQVIQIKFGEQLLKVHTEEQNGQSLQTKVWDDPAHTVGVSEQADEWFSDMFSKKVTLVKIYDDNSRLHHNKSRNTHLKVSLADGYPYLAIGTASHQLLNTKLTTPVSILRFRPNIVVDTDEPHIEDTWKMASTENVVFDNMKPCGRCMIVTIDPTTGIVNNETLTVLNTYRKSGNNVLFGTNMMCTQEGTIKVGDILNLH